MLNWLRKLIARIRYERSLRRAAKKSKQIFDANEIQNRPTNPYKKKKDQ